jgi:hypothetical protein
MNRAVPSPYPLVLVDFYFFFFITSAQVAARARVELPYLGITWYDVVGWSPETAEKLKTGLCSRIHKTLHPCSGKVCEMCKPHKSNHQRGHHFPSTQVSPGFFYIDTLLTLTSNL